MDPSQIVGTSCAASRWPESGGLVSTRPSLLSALAMTDGGETAGGTEPGSAPGAIPDPADGSGTKAASAGAPDTSAPASRRTRPHLACSRQPGRSSPQMSRHLRCRRPARLSLPPLRGSVPERTPHASSPRAHFPKFVLHCRTTVHELRKVTGTGKPMILVPLSI